MKPHYRTARQVNPVYAGTTRPKPLTSERGIFTRGPKRHQPDLLRADCWCRATTLGVPRTEILDGLTRTCGLPNCDAYDRTHRARGAT